MGATGQFGPKCCHCNRNLTKTNSLELRNFPIMLRSIGYLGKIGKMVTVAFWWLLNVI